MIGIGIWQLAKSAAVCSNVKDTAWSPGWQEAKLLDSQNNKLLTALNCACPISGQAGLGPGMGGAVAAAGHSTEAFVKQKTARKPIACRVPLFPGWLGLPYS